MATYLFDDFADFKSFAGGTVNQSVALESLAPAMEETLHTHLLPWLSQEMYDELDAAIASPSTQEEALLQRVKKAFALLTMYEYTATASIQVSDAGMMRVETEDMKSAYKYQEAGYREWMLHTGYNRLEDMIRFLNSNVGDYATWAGTLEAQRSRELFLNYAADFRRVHSKSMSRYTFEVLRPVIEDVQVFGIRANIGDDFYTELQAAVKAQTTTAAQDKVVALIQKAIAHLSVNEGVKQGIVQIKGDMVTKSETLEPQGYVRKGAPTAADIDLKTHYEYTTGNRHMSELLAFLSANQDDYPTYKAYLEAKAAAAEAEQTETAEWQDERCCGTCGLGVWDCSCSTKNKRKRIVRL